MKKVFQILVLIVVTISCKCEETLTVFTLTSEEKSVIPYQLEEKVKWSDNNNVIHNGSLIKKTEDYDGGTTGPEECAIVEYNRLISYIQFDNFKYEISLYKMNQTSVDLVIQEYVDNKAIKAFMRDIKLEHFTTIQFNGETYENAVLLIQSTAAASNKPFGHLVYSKTHGIEFILFEDGSWYKRVE